MLQSFAITAPPKDSFSSKHRMWVHVIYTNVIGPYLWSCTIVLDMSLWHLQPLGPISKMASLFGYSGFLQYILYEPPHDKTNKMACAPSKDSDQPGSLGIRPVWSVFAVCMKNAWVLSYPLSAQQRLWSDWADAQGDQSLMGSQSFCWFCREVVQLWWPFRSSHYNMMSHMRV